MESARTRFVIRIAIAIAFAKLASGGMTSSQTQVSDHFDGKRYFNYEKASGYSLTQRIKSLGMQLAEWPDWINDPKFPAPPQRVGMGQLRVTHINHATMLIQVDGVNILTDPIWSNRASIVSWAGPKRVRAPGIDLKNLPPIDVILISHNHYDHLDIPTLRQLTTGKIPRIIVGKGVGALLREEGFGAVTELDWWQEYGAPLHGLKVTFVPARHSSGRGMFDKDKTLWGGFVIGSDAGNIYFAGDTAYGDFFADINKRLGPFRLAILPLGHYEPRWMMEAVHMNPDDAVRAHKTLAARQSVGMHFGTFHGMGAHNAEAVDQHVSDLDSALTTHSVPASEFWLLGFGEGRDVP